MRVPGVTRNVELVDRTATGCTASEVTAVAVLVDAVSADLGMNCAPGGTSHVDTVAVLVDAIATDLCTRCAGRGAGEVTAVAVLVDAVSAHLGGGDGNGERAHERAIDAGPNAGECTTR